ncbi:MAG: DNA gyrase subunit A [Desulfovibrionaceae bacterium]|nr:DNA gyrase subunit A [Desulfovibrionaceae bacterium]
MSQDISIEQEMRSSYLEYSLSVIIGRAIPDARDGLKPVHRRILFAQQELANSYSRPPKKCARIVGDVIGKYHPHGDSAVYDALVRMAQDFSMRDPLEDGQGNFGSIDGDSAAAMRYTEVRMSKIAGEFLSDIDKETVDFRPNYDNTLAEPVVLPTRVPNLLLNGSSGIAVGMATNIPPHNLSELCDALLLLIERPEASVGELMQYVHGPDFPTGGSVYAGQGLYDAYASGRGTVKIRGRMEVEEHRKHQSIIIREIPFGLNKASLVERIAALVNDHKIDNVADLRDESDRRGIRVVIDLKRGAIPEVVINAIYKFTPMETSFGINMLAVVDNRPVLLNLKSALSCFLDHRREVVVRRTRFELKRAEARAHILHGLLAALDHIDEVVALIRSSDSPQAAKDGLTAVFSLSSIQAQAILDMRLQRLTGLERKKLEEELRELTERIAGYHAILDDTSVLWSVIRDEIVSIRETYGSPRKTDVVSNALEDINIEDLLPDDDVVITLSRRGYVKRTAVATYRQQRRGGVGVAGVQTSEDDMVQDFITTTNHQFLLLFTNRGRMHQLKVHQVPEGSRTAKGVHIANLIPMEKDERITTAFSVRDFSPDKSFLFATRNGMVKRSAAELYARARKGGLLAVGLREDDELIMVREVCDNEYIMLATANGMAIRFHASEVRNMGRGACGVKGIALRSGDSVVACLVLGEQNPSILTLCAHGYGKRSRAELYRPQSRGGLGIINFKVTAKTGPVVGSMPVNDDQGLVVLTSSNKIVRTGVDEIRSIGRSTQGVRIVNVEDGAHVVGFDTTVAAQKDTVETSEENQ